MPSIKHLLILFLLVAFSKGIYGQLMNVRGWSKTERDSLEQGLALLQEKKGETALPLFENILSNHPNEEFLKYTYAKCALLCPDRQADAYKRLNEVFEKNRKAPEIYYYLALAAYQNYNYDEAILRINTHLNNRRIAPEDKARGELLKKQINVARYYYTHPTRAKIANLGNQFNSPLNETHPSINAEEIIFIYNGRLPADADKDNQLLCSEKEEGEFKSPVKLNIVGNSHDFDVVGLSNDGGILFLSKKTAADSGDLYQSFLVGDAYSKPQKLKGMVNSAWCENHCSLSPNKQLLYFSSNRAGGKGGMDIYRATLLADSLWGNVINLGDSINTAFDEETPFMHTDGKTLFFSSNRSGSMGGFDIFRSTMQQKDSSFKKVENLGSPINTPGDEMQFVVSANGENAYLSSNRKDGRGLFDIYHVEPNLKGFKPSLCLFKGKVLKNEKPVSANVLLETLSPEKKQFGTLSSNALSGNFLAVLPTGGEYQLTFSIKNYKSKTVTVDLSDMVGFVEKIKNVNFDAMLDSIRNTSNAIAPPANTFAVVSGSETSAKLSVNTISNTAVSSSTLSAPAQTLHTKNTVLPDSAIIQSTKTNTVNPVAVITSSVPVVKVAAKKDSVLKISADSVLKASAKTQTLLTKNDLGQVKNTKTKTDSIAKHVAKTDSVNKTAIVKTTSLSGSVNPSVSVSSPSLVVTATVNSSNTKSLSVKSSSNSNAGNKVVNDNFEPNTAVQEKMMVNAYKYGDISYDSLEFRVQVSAFKNNQHYFFPKLEKFGKIEKVELGDGYKRLMLGGSFKTYGRAFAYAKKIIRAGHDEVFIVVVYKGYRYSVEDLEAVGIFK